MQDNEDANSNPKLTQVLERERERERAKLGFYITCK
jgi:hypothetical protein